MAADLVEKKWERVADDDPNRCTATHRNFQCPYRALGNYNQQSKTWDGPDKCKRHRSRTPSDSPEAKDLKMYRLHQWQTRMEQLADHPKLKTTREELGVLRLLLEHEFSKCQNANESVAANNLSLASTKLLEITREITKTVNLTAQLEKQLGQVMDKSQAIAFINFICSTLAMYIKDEMILQLISEDLEAYINKVIPVS